MENLVIKTMNKIETQPLVSTWLIPIEKDRNLLSAKMNELSDHYDAPKFMPHITLYSSHVPKKKVDQAKNLVSLQAKLLKPLSLTVSTIKHSNFLSKSFYAEFKKDHTLDKLHTSFRKIFEKYGDYTFNPHLSLRYKILDSQANERIIKRLQIPRTIIFDTLGVLVYKDKQEQLNIPGWEVTIYDRK